MNIQIGIDVGYSDRGKTCGIAASTEAGFEIVGWPKGDASWQDANGRQIFCTTTTLDNLVVLAAALIKANTNALFTNVLDGPMGQNGPPARQRHVDHECQRGQFRNRAVPASVIGGGRSLVAATYRVTRALAGANSGPNYRFCAARDVQAPRAQLFETMPTVGLAVLLPVVSNWRSIPSRSHPVGGIRQKSDFYWERGAGNRVASILGCVDVAKERHHDRRAALYCLAVAMQIDGASRAGSPICIGDPSSGVYVLAGDEDPTWKTALDGVGRIP